MTAVLCHPERSEGPLFLPTATPSRHFQHTSPLFLPPPLPRDEGIPFASAPGVHYPRCWTAEQNLSVTAARSHRQSLIS